MTTFEDAKRNRSDTDLEVSFPGIPKRQKATHGDDDGDQGHGQGQAPRKLSPSDYTVGWICALPIEMAAAKAMLDDVHDSLLTSAYDTNAYTMGNIGVHNIVIACLPARQYGTNSAATVASNMRRSFPSIHFGLMVGIGGGVPGRVDLRLGDVVVSDQVVQYDLGKTVQDGHFERTGTLNKPPQALMTAVAKLQADHALEPSRIPSILSEMLRKHTFMTRFTHPGTLQDRLFDGTYDHVLSMDSCELCDTSMLLNRPARTSTDPKIHYGVIASGNQVMKHGRTRDQLAQELGVLCFEMEAAGLMDIFPCLVVRGICDYSDSHKNKQWQEYAAATAAAYAKELLSVIPFNGFNGTPAVAVMSSDADRHKDLLASLSFDQIDARRSTVKANYSNTCQWLLTHTDYLDWVDPTKAVEHHGFLWIKGKPGAGKSTIMNFAYNQATKDTSNRVISFFFSARGSKLERSTTGMYRSLLFQLLKALPSHVEIFDGLEHKGELDALHAMIVCQRRHPEWGVGLLQGLLRNAVQKLGQECLTCFIDALDECTEDQVEGMIEYFENLGTCAISNGIHLRICFSSRHYPHIDIQYGRKLTLELQEGHEKDVATYIQRRLKVGKSKSAEEIRNKMQAKAGGIFMWVVLVVDILNKEYSRGRIFDVKKRLDAIPTGLSDLFREILSRDQNNLQDMRLCIQWILFAKRPLKLEEYYFAAVSGLSADELGEWDPEDVTRDDMDRFLLSSSKGLAETTKTKSPTVQFIHESVREFFLKDGQRELWPDLTGDFQSFSHDQLKQCCHTYTKLDISPHVPSGPPLPKASSDAAKSLRCLVSDKFPFLEYATHHVLYHADAAASRLPQDDFLKAFDLEAWISLENLFEKFEIRRHTSAASLLYVLAENNFASLISPALHLDSRIWINGERHRCPLFAALANGHQDAVRALFQETNLAQKNGISAQLEYGRNFIAPKNQTPLQWAMHSGHVPLVMHMIASKEFGFSIANDNDSAVLSWAADKGHEEVMKLLLGVEGVDVNSKNNNGQTLLSLAAEKGHEGTVKVLLEVKGIDVNLRDNLDRTPLSYAVIYGHKGVVKLLLDTKGVDANSKNIFGQTPLSWAAETGRIWLVKLLLKNKDVDRSLEDEYGRTPLSSAAENGHEAVVRLLLLNGADTEARNRFGRTPLFLAVMGGREAVKLLLLKNGPDVVVRDRYGRTPLSDAVRSGLHAVMDLFLEEDPDAETKDGTRQEATPRATGHGNGWGCVHGDVGDGLFSEADHNSRGGVHMAASSREEYDRGRSARRNAARRVCVVQLLLDKGADIEAEDNYVENPLLWAEKKGHQAVVQLLRAWRGAG